MDQQGNDVRKARIASNVKDIIQFFDYIEGPVKIVIEACGIKDNIIDALREHQYEVLISNPVTNKLIGNAKVKTDKIDAKALANLLRAGMIHTTYYPPPAIRALRNLIKQRAYYVQECTRCKNRIQRMLLRNGTSVPRGITSKVGKAILRRDDYPDSALIHNLICTMEHYESTINQLTQNLKEVAATMPSVGKIQSIYGFGLINAATIWGEIGEIDRFKNSKKLVGLAGLYPTTHQSGETHYKGHLARTGSPTLRTALVLSAQVHIRKDSHITRTFKKLSKNKPFSVAMAAAARKLLVSIYYMLKNNQPFTSPSCS